MVIFWVPEGYTYNGYNIKPNVGPVPTDNQRSHTVSYGESFYDKPEAAHDGRSDLIADRSISASHYAHSVYLRTITT